MDHLAGSLRFPKPVQQPARPSQVTLIRPIPNHLACDVWFVDAVKNAILAVFPYHQERQILSIPWQLSLYPETGGFVTFGTKTCGSQQ